LDRIQKTDLYRTHKFYGLEGQIQKKSFIHDHRG
jgi:hypothetical protein